MQSVSCRAALGDAREGRRELSGGRSQKASAKEAVKMRVTVVTPAGPLR